MPLPRDPDVLRVPAFMRKRSLVARRTKPLVLTALDRKQTGVVLPALKKPKKKKPRIIAKTTRRPRPTQKMESFSAPLLDFYAEPDIPSPQRKRLLRRVPAKRARNDKSIGTLTHYYNKIKVGVIKLTATLSVGDCIEYETDEGPYRQIVESMEINREPAFKGGRGKEVGLKLRKIPRVGSVVMVSSPT